MALPYILLREKGVAMAWWKWHQGDDQGMQDPVGPAITYAPGSDGSDGSEGAYGTTFADEPTGGSLLTRFLASELRRQGVSTPRSYIRMRVDQ